jgi:hypothetical protein
MWARGRPRILERVDETTISIQLDLCIACDSLSGTLVDAAGRQADFLGRVGLLAAIEEVVRSAIPSPEPDRSLP